MPSESETDLKLIREPDGEMKGKLEPAVGIEPTTCRLRIDCTTTVLRRQRIRSRTEKDHIERGRGGKSLPFIKESSCNALKERVVD